MIISHKHKYIFLKTNKTAGTSIEIALSKSCGKDDIITHISPEDELTRSKLGARGPQNFGAPYGEYGFYDWARLLIRRRSKLRYYNHMNATQVNGLIGDEIWNSYFKFCFERNPWDRVVSLYFFRHPSGSGPSLTEFIESDEPLALKQRGFGIYSIDGKVVVDKVCRFENIAGEMEEVRKQLGIPEELDLPRAKSRFRKDKRSYRDILDQEQREKIAELFRDEIEYLGYEF